MEAAFETFSRWHGLRVTLRRALVRWLALAVFSFSGASLHAAESYKVELPFRSSVKGVVRLYYSTGGRFIQARPPGPSVQANKRVILKFDLPAGLRLKSLRLDLLHGAGSFEIGPANITAPDGHLVRQLALQAYQVRQQLDVISKDSSTLKLVAPPHSRDPMLTIELQPPLDLPLLQPQGEAAKTPPSKSRYDWPVWIDVGLILLALLTLGSVIFPSMKRVRLSSSGWLFSPRWKWMDGVAAKFSDPELIIFDRTSLLVLFAAGAIFILFCVFQLHGSSVAMWDREIANQTPHNGLLWGNAKRVRSDEFTVFTPNIFSQIYSKPAYSPVNRTVGGEQSVLFWSYPVNHFIEIPRFFLWPFHVVSIDRAFSIYWNFKGLILFVGSYLLLLLITHSRAWLAAAGALWIYFSSFTQWWFSHCLPEDIGFAALTVVGALYLIFSRQRLLVYTGAIVFTVALLNFALILYPPFAIPIGFVMLSVGLGFLIEKRKLLFSPDPLKIRWALLSVAIVLCATTLVAFALDTRQTIHMILNTVYPGHRINTGGTEPFLVFLTSFIDPIFTENYIPKIVTNVCTGTHYYLIGLLLVPVIFIARRGYARFTAMDVLLALCSLMMAAFVVIGFPEWLSKITLLSMTESKRAKAGIGLAAVFLTMRYFSRTPGDQQVRAADWQIWISLLAALAIGFIFFETATAFPIPPLAISMLLVVNASLLLFGVAGQSARFFAVLLPLLLTHCFLINPIATGFKAITEKNLYREVRDIRRSDPNGKWVSFGSFRIANFLKFCGVEVINGNKFYPVFDYNNVLDPQHNFINIWNCYGHVEFSENREYPHVYYEQQRGPKYRVNLPASAPALEKIGVRYCVMTDPLPVSYRAAVLRQVRDGTKNYWILRRDLIPLNPLGPR